MTELTERTWYLAGPMSGIAGFNFPAFEMAAFLLRDRGYNVISPVELDDRDEYRRAINSPNGDPADLTRPWGQTLARDLKVLLNECTGIILLDGWRFSKGAILELSAAMLAGKEVARFTGETHLMYENYNDIAALMLHRHWYKVMHKIATADVLDEDAA